MSKKPKAKTKTKSQRLLDYLYKVAPGDEHRHQFVGIDPGWGGSLTFLTFPQRGQGFTQLGRETFPMPDDEGGILDVFSDHQGFFQYPFLVCLEKVSGFAGVRHPGSLMFRFGANYGACRTALAVQDLREGYTYHCPTPQEWQRGLLLPPRKKGEADADWKRRVRDYVVELTGWKVTVSEADSVAIALYCALLFGGGRLPWPDGGLRKLAEGYS